jgi:hypothetical protein
MDLYSFYDDIVVEFLDENQIVNGGKNLTKQSIVFQRFCRWSEDNHYGAMSAGAFTRCMDRLGIKKLKDPWKKVYLIIELKPENQMVLITQKVKAAAK